MLVLGLVGRRGQEVRGEQAFAESREFPRVYCMARAFGGAGMLRLE